jgi:PAS domain S-box-containing protein
MAESVPRLGRFHSATLAIVTASVCYLAARLAGALVITTPQTLWPYWPGCAVLVAILLVSPTRLWRYLIPAGVVGFVIYDVEAGVPWRSVGYLVLVDIGEVLGAAGGVCYFLNGLPRLDSLRKFAKYCFFTLLLASFFAATVGVYALDGDRWVSWRSIFLSEGLAFLTVTPAILGWVAYIRSRTRPSAAFFLEASVLGGALIFLTYLAFIAPVASPSIGNPVLLYSLVPFLVWSALRFGSAGAATAATIVAVCSVWGTLHGRGPFTIPDPIHRVLSLQLFLWCTAVPFMVLAILVEERKRQESVLRESEERFRLMADTAPTLIWMSGTDKLCSFFNQGWLSFTGRAHEDELGNGWASSVHPDDLPRCMNTYNSAFDARTKFVMEYRLLRYDNQYRWIVDYGVPRFGSNGIFCGYIGSCIDITERKLSENFLHELTGRLISAQEEERARIARELHDDISQRMAFLQIGLDQFEQAIRGLTPNERNELRNLTQVASEISSDLHSISHQLHPARLDLQGLVAAMNSLCKELAIQHDLQINFVHYDVPANIPSDVALCLFRIVQESLRNIIKHGKTSEAQVELSSDNDWIDLSVSDSGTGFNPEIAQGKGGLGLVSMRERLRHIVGRLTIQSAPNHGTQIRVRVPLAATTSEPATPQSQKSQAHA